MAKRLVSYDSAWPGDYEAVVAEIAAAWEPGPVRLHHIGSTAVPGLDAKPIIDVLGEVRALTDAEAAGPALRAIGFDARGEHGIAGRRYFSRAEGAGLAVHLHVFETGADEIARHLRLRDYLRAVPEARDSYAALKWRLADANGFLPADYPARKLACVTALEGEALAYFSNTRRIK